MSLPSRPLHADVTRVLDKRRTNYGAAWDEIAPKPRVGVRS